MHSYKYRLTTGSGDKEGLIKLLRDSGLHNRKFELWEAAEILSPEMDYSASTAVGALVDLIRRGHLIEV